MEKDANVFNCCCCLGKHVPLATKLNTEMIQKIIQDQIHDQCDCISRVPVVRVRNAYESTFCQIL